MKQVVVTGAFDNLRSRDVLFLEKASAFGDVHVLVWSDETVRALEGRAPTFPQEERAYMLQGIRFVSRVTLVAGLTEHDSIPPTSGLQPDVWAVHEANDTPKKRTYCKSRGMAYQVVEEASLWCFPPSPFDPGQIQPSTKRVIVTGCFDWFHSGHIRFFEEVSQLGDLYGVVGHDANIRLLKGAGHPMFSQDERRYMVQSVRYVKQALISSGTGWLDAEPEIPVIKPHIYAVNEDGDKPEKKAFCRERGIQYVVLKRIPKEGLPARQSTDLRGF